MTARDVPTHRRDGVAAGTCEAELAAVLDEIRRCRVCADVLPLGPRPVLQASSMARIFVCGQAPGTRVHETGLPFNDPSGDRLRQWMGIDRATFYDPALVTIVPMGFCYPGKDGRGGDARPRPECASTWHDRLFEVLPAPRLKLVIGRYAQAYHLKGREGKTLTETVRNWRSCGEGVMPLPHPSPRNIAWFKNNPWFEAEVVPAVQSAVRTILGGQA